MLYYIIVNVHIMIQYVHYVGWTGAQEQEGFIDVSRLTVSQRKTLNPTLLLIHQFLHKYFM